MPSPTKSDVVADFRRSQILAAAERSFARHGLQATTVDQIARAAKLAKGTVYLYYRSKDEIVRHALDDGLAALQAATVPVIAAPGAFEEKLRRFLSGMLGHFDRHREFIELCQLELNSEARRKAHQTFGRIYAAQTRAWQTAIAGAARGGEVAAVNPRQTALAIVSLAHGLAIQRLRGWTNAPLDKVVSHATTLLWKGLAAR